jgi:NAD(P)-dependent dehydrogenase (short-subunit alcohol dehydrogenase family)
MEHDKLQHNDGAPSSRRQFVVGAATGIAAAVAAPVLAQAPNTAAPNKTAPNTAAPNKTAQNTAAPNASGAGQAPPQSVKRNPVTQYPKPPFQEQKQPFPGLASRMTPRPDHGETTYKGSGRLLGRKALITGGDSGIGRAAAIAFAREGADVAINYLPAEEPDAREVVELIRAAGRKAVAIPGDIQSEEFCQRLVREANAQLGGLDILVNNAARQQTRASIAEISTEDFDATFKTNVYAMFWITKAALPGMGPGACIINTASVQAYDPSENLLDYAQTKACIVSFTKSLAKQVAPRGIRVNAVAPGPFWTPLQVAGGQLPGKLPEFGAQTPMERPGQPAEIASLYVLLASQESSYSIGQVLGASGGGGNP